MTADQEADGAGNLAEMAKAQLSRQLSEEFVEQHRGEVVVVDVDTGEWATGKTIVACNRSMSPGAGKRRFALRVGGGPVYRFGGLRVRGKAS